MRKIREKGTNEGLRFRKKETKVIELEAALKSKD